MLISPLNSFPWVVNGLIQGWVSLKRLQGYLNLKNLNWYEYYKLSGNNSNVLINVQNASFKWNLTKKKTENEDDKIRKKSKKTDEPANNTEDDNLIQNKSINGNSSINSENTDIILNNISFKIEKGKFIGVVGRVGTGKTSLLNSILGEISKFNELNSDNRMIEIDNELLAEGFAYSAQDCWIQASTIRDNILFGQPYDEEKYKRVLFACALSDDLQLLPKNDETPVGESGVTLSGGQKARLCLARACYQNKSLYLLDDPLSAVDTHVAKHIYDHCINGLLANKTRILSTHHLKFLLNADSVLVIDHNTIVRQGSAREIIPDYMQMFSLLKASDNDNEINIEDNNNDSVEDEMDGFAHADKIETALKAKDELDEIEVKENDEEEKEHGVISWRVYKYYCLSIGVCLTFIVFLSLFAMQGILTFVFTLNVFFLNLFTIFQRVEMEQISGCLTGLNVII